MMKTAEEWSKEVYEQLKGHGNEALGCRSCLEAWATDIAREAHAAAIESAHCKLRRVVSPVVGEEKMSDRYLNLIGSARCVARGEAKLREVAYGDDGVDMAQDIVDLYSDLATARKERDEARELLDELGNDRTRLADMIDAARTEAARLRDALEKIAAFEVTHDVFVAGLAKMARAALAGAPVPVTDPGTGGK